jgi:ABC-type proline/glycine betaine transport system substrate-binding protein
VITATISATNTSAITVTTAYYDIEAEQTATGIVRRVLRGRVIVSSEITR